MLSVAVDRNGSPKKRSLSRGISEDESLRSIIKEAESSTRRLTRSDSRGGTLKRMGGSQQSDQDLFMGLPEMMELQASYDKAVQELCGLEVERETLLFQVDVLQDSLEGVEELLAEAQREAGQANRELEQEKEAKRKLEDTVHSLMLEVERLKEERNTFTLNEDERREPGTPLATHSLVNIPTSTPYSCTDGPPAPSFSKGKNEESPGVALHNPHNHVTVDPPSVGGGGGEGSPLAKLHRMVNTTLGQMPSLALVNRPSQDGVFRRPGEGHAEDARDESPERNNDSDSVSAYEDASADTPELERMFDGDPPADAPELPDDDDVDEEGKDADQQHSDSCVVS